MNLFMLGDFTLNSGAKSSWKLECDALTDADIDGLAEMIYQMVGPFGSVEGVPRGGLRLAKALEEKTYPDCRHLIVDDVLTTWNSMWKVQSEYLNNRRPWLVEQEDTVIGAVIFARGPCPLWVKPLFQMPEVLWVR